MRIHHLWILGAATVAAAGCSGSTKPGGSTSSTGHTATSGTSGATSGTGSSTSSGTTSSSSGTTSGGGCTACTPTQVCINGTCIAACGAHESVCTDGGYCADLSDDSNNCGGCGTVCPNGKKCALGACVTSCPGDETVCGGGCVNLMDDNLNCGGACNISCADAGLVCSNGTCGPSCSAPYQTMCGSGPGRFCADLQNDPIDCGGCDTACSNGTFCSEGQCTAQCQGVTDVNCGGICVDTLTDEESCGACGSACGAGHVCYGGTCVAACGSPDSTCTFGSSASCADLLDDPRNCGACGNACAPGQVCADGECAATCPGAAGTLCNGLCVHLDSDNQSCGACGTGCDGGYCNGFGTCAGVCGAGFALCGTGLAAHCADLTSYDSDCGACGTSCAAGVACASGVCGGVPDSGVPDSGIPDSGVPDSGPSGPPTCDGGCGDGLACYGGVCVSQSCEAFACTPGFACIDGGCAQGSCDGIACSTGDACGNGACYPTSCGGTACADGGLCWQGSCVESDCAGITCGSGAVCAGGQCWPSCAGCNAPSVCVSGTCQSGCTIGSSTYSAGTINAANFCQICDPNLDPGDWSPLGGGNACALGGEVCVNGTCEEGCSIGGAGYAEGANDPSNHCLVCNATLNGSGWSAGNNDTGCAAGKFCRGGACLSGCEIGGTGFVQPNTLDPSNDCQSCLPAQSSTTYSFLSDGTVCTSDGGSYCVSGQCLDVCLIDGGVVEPGISEASDGCQTCQPQLTTAQYSAVTGTVPVSGLCPSIQDVCLSGACTLGCYIDGGFVAPATFGPDAGSNLQCCTPSFSTTLWSQQFQEQNYSAPANIQGLFSGNIQGLVGPALFVTGNATNTLTVFPNNGDGTFGAGTGYAFSTGNNQLVGSGDINGDGIPDIVGGNNSGQVTILLGLDGGGFQPPTLYNLPTMFQGSFVSSGYAMLGLSPNFYPAGGNPGGGPAAIINWDNNNYFSININAWSPYSQFDAGPGGIIDGGPSLVMTQRDGVGWYEIIPATGVQEIFTDLNGDGLDDFAFTQNDPALSGGVAVMINGAGSLGPLANLYGHQYTYGLAAGPFFSQHYPSGAPYMDLVTSVPIGDGGWELQILGNDGTGNFGPAGNPLATPGSGYPLSLAAADVNGDGNTDVIALMGQYTIQVFYGDGNGNLTAGPTFGANDPSNQGALLLAGPYGPSGTGAFFSVTNSSAATLFTDVCK